MPYYSSYHLVINVTAAEPEAQSVDTSCTEWRITTIVLIVALAFLFGICCASSCILVILRKLKTKRRSRKSQMGMKNKTTAMKLLNMCFFIFFLEPADLTNPMYTDKQVEGVIMKGFENSCMINY